MSQSIITSSYSPVMMTLNCPVPPMSLNSESAPVSVPVACESQSEGAVPPHQSEPESESESEPESESGSELLAFAYKQLDSEQFGRILQTALSPNRVYLAKLGESGTIIFLDLSNGHIFGRLVFGHDNRVTVASWIDDHTIILGSVSGKVQVGRIAETSPNTFVKLTTVVHQGHNPVVSLDFDQPTSQLAYCDSSCFYIGTLHLDKTHGQIWTPIDHSVLKPALVGGWAIRALFLFGKEHSLLLIVAEKGLIVWSIKERRQTEQHLLKDSLLGHCVMSPDESYITASTQDLKIISWPLNSTGPMVDQESVREIPNGRKHIPYTLTPPLDIMDDKVIITADPLGYLYTFSTTREGSDLFETNEGLIITSIQYCKTLMALSGIGPETVPCTVVFLGSQERKSILNAGPGKLPIVQTVKSRRRESSYNMIFLRSIMYRCFQLLIIMILGALVYVRVTRSITLFLDIKTLILFN
ncbi:hypothetical protein BDV93DRAFT_558798 [Ceratobasidium sp. AG-I]|nr:hypothetical protein BDV93DRAFT_558798 [Ceratobasidium sp. AG-I]